MTYENRSLCCILIGLVGVGCIGGCRSINRPSEAERQAERYGVNYVQLQLNARNGDQALRQFFLLSHVVDGAGAEQYAHDLSRILQDIGENRFLNVLRSVNWDMQEHVLQSIGYDQGFEQDDVSWVQFTERYPALANNIESRRIQGF